MASQQKARIAAGFLLGAWYLPEVQCINRQQPSTINHQPSTINHQPSAISHQPSTTTNVPTYQLSRA
ncbi:hypothetical protein [Xanthomonas campestris]|uniref:hypothetical protein n=1 Tax=Xanthomonas campestris TaxID=339 RepID=UPI00021AF713|nr:hypothetical protein [Xanthomonas campestris]AEL05233.1 CD68 antigen, putative [Xanthomonas campestris pv. raphani 756C]MEA9674446.1 hypothetical protein [Xanthomonas campestris pv. raphani]MEA9918216.1 hypothetical protein [Xanthomonas campestris pv. raphani]